MKYFDLSVESYETIILFTQNVPVKAFYFSVANSHPESPLKTPVMRPFYRVEYQEGYEVDLALLRYQNDRFDQELHTALEELSGVVWLAHKTSHDRLDLRKIRTVPWSWGGYLTDTVIHDLPVPIHYEKSSFPDISDT